MAKSHTTEVAIIPRARVTEISGWEDLSTEEQHTVYREVQALAKAMEEHGLSKLAMGEHLAELRRILEPQRMFLRILEGFRLSRATAYRYISAFENANKLLPQNILRAAMARGIDFARPSDDRPLGVYTDVVKRLPPPKTKDPKVIDAYVDQLAEAKKKAKSNSGRRHEADRIPDHILKETYRFVVTRFRMLPNNSRTRSNFVRDLVGMMLTELGVGNSQSYEPIAVPEGYRAVRGRPIGSKKAG